MAVAYPIKPSKPPNRPFIGSTHVSSAYVYDLLWAKYRYRCKCPFLGLTFFLRNSSQDQFATLLGVRSRLCYSVDCRPLPPLSNFFFPFWQCSPMMKNFFGNSKELRNIITARKGPEHTDKIIKAFQ